jgi:hypothetical protein
MAALVKFDRFSSRVQLAHKTFRKHEQSQKCERVRYWRVHLGSIDLLLTVYCLVDSGCVCVIKQFESQ